MVIQDNKKSGDKLALHIGGGFDTQPEGYKKLYPQERLLKFLNVNINDENEINDFCNEYTFIPRDMSSGLVVGFKKEYWALKRIVQGAQRDALTKNSFRKINSVLNTIETEVNYEGSSDLHKANSLIGRDYLSSLDGRLKHFGKFRKHKGTVASLWEDAVNQIINTQQVRPCVACGQYFEISKQAPSHIYCSDTCRNRINQGERRKRLKEAKHVTAEVTPTPSNNRP